MHAVFLFSLLIGGSILALQIILSLVGFDTDMAELDVDLEAPDADLGGSDASAGLDLFGVRSISAGLATFGAVGLLLDPLLFSWLAALLALVPAGLAMLGTAYLTLLMLRLESDGSIQLDNAVGTVGTVYLTVPAGAALPAGRAEEMEPGVGGPGAADASGLVHLTVQGRTIEVRAITREAESLPTGASVLVVAAEGDTVEVVPTPVIEGL